MFTCLFYQKIKDQTDQKLPQGSYRKPNAEYCQKIIDFEFVNEIWTIRHTTKRLDFSKSDIIQEY